MAIPGILELASFLGASILSGWLQIQGDRHRMRQEAKLANHELEMARLGKQAEITKEARESKTLAKSWVRRTIAVTAIFFIVAWPKIIPLIKPDVPVAVSYSTLRPDSFFRPEAELVEWVVVNGVAVTPLDTMIAFAIVGMFFGSEITGKSRR